jgi:hypothetical protein
MVGKKKKENKNPIAGNCRGMVENIIFPERPVLLERSTLLERPVLPERPVLLPLSASLKYHVVFCRVT